jgi:hypothetical protein
MAAAWLAAPGAEAGPSQGLDRHPFLLSGEWDHRKTEQTLFLIRSGKVAWSHSVPMTNPDGTGNELGDATLLKNGNVLFAYKTGAAEVTPDHQIVWKIDARPNAEIHTLQPVGDGRVLVVENGDPARFLIINTATGAIEKELHPPVPNPQKPHIQFRRVRMTPTGTFVAGHLDDKKVVEYDGDGKAIWTYPILRPWGLQRLDNGNTLISCYTEDVHTQVIEVTPAGEVVWRFDQSDVADYKCYQFQGVKRLANGNTVICNWCAGDVKDTAQWPGTVQVFEVTRAKKIVWALSAWQSPDLGTASSIQLLDQTGGYGVSA